MVFSIFAGILTGYVLNVMICGTYINQGEDITEVYQLRQKIFDSSDYDLATEKDPLAVNIILRTDENDGSGFKAVGTGRLVLDPELFEFHVDNLGIIESYRGKHYADFILKMLADKAALCGADRIWAEVPACNVNFFEHEHFRKISGSEDTGMEFSQAQCVENTGKEPGQTQSAEGTSKEPGQTQCAEGISKKPGQAQCAEGSGKEPRQVQCAGNTARGVFMYALIKDFKTCCKDS